MELVKYVSYSGEQPKGFAYLPDPVVSDIQICSPSLPREAVIK